MNKTASSNWALLVIAVALAGAGVSYNYTLQSRFAEIEQKIDQNSTVVQQAQITEETNLSTKTEALASLQHEVQTLEASVAQLKETTTKTADEEPAPAAVVPAPAVHEQAAARKAPAHHDEPSMSDRVGRTEQPQTQAAPAPVRILPISTAAPATTAPRVIPVAVIPAYIVKPAASAPTIHLPFAPHAESIAVLRPPAGDVTTVASNGPERALPADLP